MVQVEVVKNGGGCGYTHTALAYATVPGNTKWASYPLLSLRTINESPGYHEQARAQHLVSRQDNVLLTQDP